MPTRARPENPARDAEPAVISPDSSSALAGRSGQGWQQRRGLASRYGLVLALADPSQPAVVARMCGMLGPLAIGVNYAVKLRGRQAAAGAPRGCRRWAAPRAR
jgi:hypothetical protein